VPLPSSYSLFKELKSFYCGVVTSTASNLYRWTVWACQELFLIFFSKSKFSTSLTFQLGSAAASSKVGVYRWPIWVCQGLFWTFFVSKVSSTTSTVEDELYIRSDFRQERISSFFHPSHWATKLSSVVLRVSLVGFPVERDESYSFGFFCQPLFWTFFKIIQKRLETKHLPWNELSNHSEELRLVLRVPFT